MFSGYFLNVATSQKCTQTQVKGALGLLGEGSEAHSGRIYGLIQQLNGRLLLCATPKQSQYSFNLKKQWKLIAQNLMYGLESDLVLVRSLFLASAI